MAGKNTELLAPGAGSGIGRQIAERLISRPDWLDLVENAIVAALKAENRVYDRGTGKMVTYPDGKTRLQAVLGVWSHLEGDPVKRVIHEHVGDPGGIAASLEAELRESPALRAALDRVLAKVDKAGAARPAEVVEVD